MTTAPTAPAPVPPPPPSTTPWRDALTAVVALLLPVVCVGCGTPDHALCRGCHALLRELPGRTRLVAGVRLDAAFEYEGTVRTLVLEWKLRGRSDVVGPLTARTGALVRAALAAAPGAVVVRVPPSRRGARRRGFDPVVSVLRRAGLRRTPALRRLPVHPTAADPADVVAAWAGGGQKERTALERVAATVGSLSAAALADGLHGRDVVLVDDVVTTGVTMAEAVRAVRAVGGRPVRCVAVASVEV